MFIFEGFIVLFVAAAPLAGLLIFNRKKYNLPKYMLVMAMIALLASTVIAIGLIGILSGGS